MARGAVASVPVAAVLRTAGQLLAELAVLLDFGPVSLHLVRGGRVSQIEILIVESLHIETCRDHLDSFILFLPLTLTLSLWL